MSDQNKCPFCGNIIEKDLTNCTVCGSFFEEPELSNVKIQEFGWFFVLYLITKGWFGLIWFLINAKAINNLATTTKDKLKLNWLIAVLLIGIVIYISMSSSISPWHLTVCMFVVLYFLYVSLTYRTLRIIQKYTKSKYSANIEINPYYIALFNIFYLIHFIDTYTNRVLQTHEHFDMKWPYLVMLIIILSIAPIALFVFNPPLYAFVLFFKGLIGI